MPEIFRSFDYWQPIPRWRLILWLEDYETVISLAKSNALDPLEQYISPPQGVRLQTSSVLTKFDENLNLLFLYWGFNVKHLILFPDSETQSPWMF